MRSLFLFFASLLLCSIAHAQVPSSFNYQSVVRDGFNVLIANQPIGVQASIVQDSVGGATLYSETHSVSTNANGLFSIQIGMGTAVSGSFSSIDWTTADLHYQIEIDLQGGSNYTLTSSHSFTTVPYAMVAERAIMSDDADADSTNELQALSISNDTIYLSNGGFVKLPAAAAETDPVFGASLASGITGSDTINWNNKLDSELDGDPTNEIELPTSGTAGDMAYWNGTAWVTIAATTNEGATLQMIGGVPTWTGGTPPPSVVTNPTTGEIWMDRNLGATQVATSSTDAAAYGDLYQWGRAADGHESRTSGTTATLATGDTPGHGDFITSSSSPRDWRNPQNNNLWQGVSGTNNPCPSGYRLPTQAEWEAERTSWSSNNAAGAFASPLKLPVAGSRGSSNGALYNVGSNGYYWSSSVGGTYSRGLLFVSGNASMYNYYRAFGLSVRCLKD